MGPPATVLLLWRSSHKLARPQATRFSDLDVFTNRRRRNRRWGSISNVLPSNLDLPFTRTFFYSCPQLLRKKRLQIGDGEEDQRSKRKGHFSFTFYDTLFVGDRLRRGRCLALLKAESRGEGNPSCRSLWSWAGILDCFFVLPLLNRCCSQDIEDLRRRRCSQCLSRLWFWWGRRKDDARLGLVGEGLGPLSELGERERDFAASATARGLK